jgi:hypothetical protein
MTRSPQAYNAAVENNQPDEAAAIAAIRVLRGILETTCEDYGYSVQSVHAKNPWSASRRVASAGRTAEKRSDANSRRARGASWCGVIVQLPTTAFQTAVAAPP